MSEEINWIDDCFRVEKGKFLWHSFSKEEVALISSLTEDACVSATRSYLKYKQEGSLEEIKTYDGTVGGKL